MTIRFSVSHLKEHLGDKGVFDGCGFFDLFIDHKTEWGAPITSTFQHFLLNQLASVIDPLNHATQFGYDSKGNVISATDPLGNQATLTYNSSGQPTSATNPLGKAIQFGYDGGDLASVTAQGTVSYTYDAADRRTTMSVPGQSTVSYTYDSLDRVAERSCNRIRLRRRVTPYKPDVQKERKLAR